MDKKILFLVSSFCLVAGTGLLLGAGYMYRSNAAFYAEAVAAEGTVVDLASHRKDGGTMYRPVVEFTDGQGRTIQISGSTASSSPEYRRGDRVQVKYPPRAPEEGRIESWSERWLGIALLGGMGIAFAGVGAALTIGALRARAGAGEAEGAPEASGTEGWRLVEAKVVSIERAEGSFGRRGWHVLAQWQDPGTGQVHVFESDEIAYDPTDYVQGRKIPVRIDPEDPGIYEVDLGSLPQAG